jgi:hypothetical protein
MVQTPTLVAQVLHLETLRFTQSFNCYGQD